MGSLPLSTWQTTFEDLVHTLKSKREAAGPRRHRPVPSPAPHTPRQACSLRMKLPQRLARDPTWAPSVGRAGTRRGAEATRATPPSCHVCACEWACMSVCVR